MAIQDLFNTVQFFTSLDPYYYTVDNRPLTDLHNNAIILGSGVDAAINAATVNGVTTGLLTSGLIGDSDLLVSDIGYTPSTLSFTLSQGFFSTKEAISGIDARLITKLALLVDEYTSPTFVPPVTGGQSADSLIQVRFVDVTTGTDNLPTYDPFNPSALGSIMTGVIEIGVKTGAAATTGAQITPTADSGWTGVFVVTLANGDIQIDSNSVTTLAVQGIGSAAGNGGGVVSATDSVEGIVELATSAEGIALSDATRVITPSVLGTIVASASASGIIELANTAEALALTDAGRAITPATLLDVFNGQVATTSANGTVQLATNAEADTGSATDTAVTPAGLGFALSNFDANAAVSAATTTTAGKSELATDAESLTGTDTTRTVTPASLKFVLDNTGAAVSDASTSVKGVAELATNTETDTGSDALRVVTPAGLSFAINNPGYLPAASATASGVVELATNAEVAAGSDNGRAVTPAGVSSSYLKLSGGTLTGGLTGTTGAFTGALTGLTVQATSAEEFKDDIHTIDDALHICNSLRGVRYNWAQGLGEFSGKTDIGLIADEVEKVLPEIVSRKDGKVASMDYGHLVGVLVNAINELHTKVTDLEGK